MISILKLAVETVKNGALTHKESQLFWKKILFIGYFTMDPFFCLNAIHDGDILLRLNPFYANDLFLYLLKTSENL